MCEDKKTINSSVIEFEALKLQSQQTREDFKKSIQDNNETMCEKLRTLFNRYVVNITPTDGNN
tara:strand:- start:3679 stop:3867 length:189 start_codon:yes stop_codon:yes gene_type:complete